MRIGKDKISLLIFGIVILAVLAYMLYSTASPGPTHINFNNNTSDGLIVLNGEGTIQEELCIARNLDDKIIVLESKYCGACRIAIPRLEKIEEELGIEIIYLDLSEDSDAEKTREFGLSPRYTPTLLVGCDVYIGVQSEDDYRTIIENFLGREGA